MKAKLIERIAQIDPDHVTVGTIQMLFPFTPKWMARRIIATGVHRGTFVLNSDGSARFVGEE